MLSSFLSVLGPIVCSSVLAAAFTVFYVKVFLKNISEAEKIRGELKISFGDAPKVAADLEETFKREEMGRKVQFLYAVTTHWILLSILAALCLIELTLLFRL